MPTINGKACVANGRNLIIQSDLKGGFITANGGLSSSSIDFYSDNYIATNGATVFTFSSPDYVFKGNVINDRIVMYDSNKNFLGSQPLDSATKTLSKPNVAYIRFSINSADEGNTTGNAPDWLSTHRYKLEKGSVATPLTPAPVDNVFSNGKQVYGRNLIPMENTTAGYVNGDNGTVNAASSISFERVTDFIEVEPNQTYWMQGEVDLHAGQAIWFGVGVYDGNKNFINRPSFVGSTATANVTDFKKWTMVIPNNAKYVRVSFRTYGNARVKLEKGATATPWTPAPEDVM